MRAGMFVWLICSAITFNSLSHGQVALSAYFLVLSCVLPVYVANEVQRRSRS